MYEFINDFSIMRWIPYSRITNLKKIAEEGFDIIYSVIWLDRGDEFDYRYPYPSFGFIKENVAIKRFFNSNDIS